MSLKITAKFSRDYTFSEEEIESNASDWQIDIHGGNEEQNRIAKLEVVKALAKLAYASEEEKSHTENFYPLSVVYEIDPEL